MSYTKMSCRIKYSPVRPETQKAPGNSTGSTVFDSGLDDIWRNVCSGKRSSSKTEPASNPVKLLYAERKLSPMRKGSPLDRKRCLLTIYSAKVDMQNRNKELKKSTQKHRQPQLKMHRGPEQTFSKEDYG